MVNLKQATNKGEIKPKTWLLKESWRKVRGEETFSYKFLTIQKKSNDIDKFSLPWLDRKPR